MLEKPHFTLNGLLKGIQRKAIDILGLDLLSKQFATLALNYLFLMVYYTVETVFVNTLIFRVTDGNMNSVVLYRVLSYLFSAIGMNLCSIFSGTITPTRAIKIGATCYLILFVILFGWMEHLGTIMYYLGALAGLSMGIYWSGHNVLMTLYTTPRNRAVGIGLTGIISGVMNLLLPLIVGFLLQQMPEMSGYRMVFGFVIAIILAQYYFMNQLTPVERKHRPRDYIFAVKISVRKLSLRVMMLMECFRGIRDGAFSFFLNMVLFTLITDEALVGFNSFLTGVFSILGAWAFGRIVTPDRRVKLAFLSIGTIFLFCAALILKLNVITVLLFGVVNTFLAYFFNNIGAHIYFEAIGQNQMVRQVITELTGLREITLDIGRITGLFIVYFFPKTMDGYLYAMLTLTGLQFITVALMWWAQRIFNRKERLKAKEVATL